MRSIIFEDPYKIDSHIGINCPITGFKLMYGGKSNSSLKFYPLDGPSYLELEVSILDFLSGKYIYKVNYGKIEDFILGKGRLKKDLGNLLYKEAKSLCELFKVNKRNRAFRQNNDIWEYLVYVPYIGYVSADLSEETIQEMIKKDKEEYDLSIKNGSSVRRVDAKKMMFKPEDVEVKPMGSPSGLLFYLDYKYKS